MEVKPGMFEAGGTTLRSTFGTRQKPGQAGNFYVSSVFVSRALAATWANSLRITFYRVIIMIPGKRHSYRDFTRYRYRGKVLQIYDKQTRGV